MAMLITASANHTLDALLELVCVRLQLTETQDLAVRGHYHAVSDYLSRPGSAVAEFAPHIFGAGSRQLGTTVKPLAQAEFDLDLVCLCNIQPPGHPGELYRLLWERMFASDVYRPMMRRLPRCIRLDYSGDFHLDIVPAVPDASLGGTHILVPDLDANLALDHPENDRWKVSNPKGYCVWFEGQCVYPVLNEKYARAQVDPLPEREQVHEKPALKRSTQLFKRWRDVRFKNEPSLASPSIILTTLSGHLYGGEMLCSDAMTTILDGVIEWIDSGQALCLQNPAHAGETICEKWEKNPKCYRAFKTGVEDFRDRWSRLLATRGIHEIEAELSELFDETPVKWAVKELARREIVDLRESGKLHVAPLTGALGATATSTSLPVRPNSFYGN